MKVVVLGKGAWLSLIIRALASLRRRAVVVTDDPAAWGIRSGQIPVVRCTDWKKLDLESSRLRLSEDDALLVVGDTETDIRPILDALRARDCRNPIVAYTPARAKQALAVEYPGISVRALHQLFATEIENTLRRWTGQRRADAMLRHVAPKKRMLVLIYGNPDPDATASAWALRALLGRAADAATLAYTGQVGRLENAAMIESLRIPLKKFDTGMIDVHDAFAIVDAQPSFLVPPFPVAFDIVIDHHPAPDDVAGGFVDVRQGYGSTSAILTEYFVHAGRKISRGLATALYYGLKCDTQDFQRNVGDADIAAFRHLHPLVDKDLIRKIELSQFELGGLDAFATALQRKRVVGDVLFSHLGPVANADLCAQVADFLMGTYGISWTVISGMASDRLVVVFRSDGYRKDAGHAARQAFAPLGSAGGHRTMARAEISLERLTQELPGTGAGEIENFVFDRVMGILRRPRGARRPRTPTGARAGE